MTTFRIVLAALFVGSGAPVAAQQWGGGGAPSAAKKAAGVTPRATRADRSTQLIVVDPSLMVAPTVDPRGTAMPHASGGGSYGPIAVSNWGGSPPAATTSRSTPRGQTSWPAGLSASTVTQSSSPEAPSASMTVQWSAQGAPSPSSGSAWSSPSAQWTAPSVVTTRGRVITNAHYRLPADSAQHADAQKKRP